MEYKRFDFLVEEMSDEDAEKLLDAIILNVEAKGLHMGGGFKPVTDADMEFWPVVKGHLRGIWEEIKGRVEDLFEEIVAAFWME